MRFIFAERWLLIVVFLAASFSSVAQPGNAQALQRVIIIRHGEKPEAGDNLSCQGLHRADLLVNVLYAKFKIPDNIFVPAIKTGKATSEARMYQTIIPFAVKYNLTVNTKYKVDDIAGVAASLLKKSGTALLIWEHKNIPLIVQALGVKNSSLPWPADDFDSIWIIDFSKGIPVLKIDKENLKPSPACN